MEAQSIKINRKHDSIILYAVQLKVTLNKAEFMLNLGFLNLKAIFFWS